MKFIIQGKLPGLNDYISSCRGSAYGANKLKKDTERLIFLYIRQACIKPVCKPVRLVIRWIEKDDRRDCDNIVFGKKFILDALVRSRILQDDSRKYVKGFMEEVTTDKNNPRIEVEILEVDE